MKIKPWVQLLLFLLFFFQLFDTQAQKILKSIKIEWTDNVIRDISDEKKHEFLHFKGATYQQKNPTLPCFFEQISIPAFYSDYAIDITNAIYEPLNSHDVSLIPENHTPTSLDVQVVSAFERNRPFALLSFVPIIKNSNGQFSRLISADITIEGKKIASQKAHKNHPKKSVLATGFWYSFSLCKTGIYKVTYQDLIDMGMSTPINASQLAVFGNGGQMLPEDNSAPRIEDLREIPIQMFDGGDGYFDKGDYFLFYGESPHTWKYDSISDKFQHTLNIYSDSSHYFITNTVSVGEKKRIHIINNAALTVTNTVNDYTHYDFLEEDISNSWESSRVWFGERFETINNHSYTFDIPGYKSGSSSRVTVAGAASSTSYSQFNIRANGNNIGSLMLPAVGNNIATMSRADYTCIPNSKTLSITLDYQQPTSSASAFLDWIEIQVPCELSMHSSQFGFCNPSSVGSGNITQFNISNIKSNTCIWDVTHPEAVVQHTLTTNGSTASFKASTTELRYFHAFDGTQFLSITPGGNVENQNLHGDSEIDLVIVTHPDFKAQAHRLAKFRTSNNGLKVKVVTTQQVYNEFSSGSQDPMAIRDYMKMMYDNTNKMYPKYLLLVGRPCYDYRGHNNGTQIFVPNYQYPISDKYIAEYNFFANDDNLGLLDDEEDCSKVGLYDIAIGRLPASTQAQVTTAIDKCIHYSEHSNIVAEGSHQIGNYGDWRNMIAFVADDEEYNDFISSAETMSSIAKAQNPNINFDKIYLDAYQQISNAGGQRYPEVNTAITNRMNRGSLFFTYVGHSGKDGWAHERILENYDINQWSNTYNLPIMLTLSCSFGYYDRPAISPAELAFFNSKGGVSAILTTTREAWSAPNNAYGRYIFQYLFNTTDKGRYPTIGEINTYAKNQYGGSGSGLAMFVLMGDPSMPLAIPTYKVVTDSINHHVVGSSLDTIRALSKVTISGHIADQNDHILNDFNGTLSPTIYDKKSTSTTLANDPGSLSVNFDVQKSILFKGNNSIQNGRFTFSFYIPKDIDYTFGNGKISYYANTTNQDGAGAFTDFIIGGTDTAGLHDTEGPQIDLFLNDENFVNGGIVEANPTLIAKIKDNYGVNTTGNGIGHDITAIIDNKTENQICLNDYYEAEKDSFNMGTVRYALNNLSVGKHSLLVRAWDINNNHSENEISFEVSSTEKLTLSHVLNYPNPFTTHTEFFFEQNQGGGVYDIQVQIYTISGKLLKTITETQYMEGNRSNGIVWNGLDDYGDKIGKGVYLYRLRVRNQNQEIAEEIEKIVIL